MTRTAWVVGASSGIGEGIAKELYKLGYEIVGLARRKTDFNRDYFLDLREGGEAIESRINHFLMMEALHITDPEEISYMWDTRYFPGWRKFWQLSKEGAPDLLVISAGAGAYLRQDLWKDWNWRDCKGREHFGVDDLIHINLTAKMWIANTMIRAMRRKRQGTILMVGSRVADRGAHALEVYGAAAAGLHGYIQSACRHPAKRNITLACVDAPWTYTPMTANLAPHITEAINKHLGQMRTVEDVSKEICGYILGGLQPGEIIRMLP